MSLTHSLLIGLIVLNLLLVVHVTFSNRRVMMLLSTEIHIARALLEKCLATGKTSGEKSLEEAIQRDMAFLKVLMRDGVFAASKFFTEHRIQQNRRP